MQLRLLNTHWSKNSTLFFLLVVKSMQVLLLRLLMEEPKS